MRQVHNLREWNLPMIFDHIEIDANNFALMADMYTAVLPTVLNVPDRAKKVDSL